MEVVGWPYAADPSSGEPWSYGGLGAENASSDSLDDVDYGNYTGLQNQYVLPTWKDALWSTLFGVMVAVSTTGNVIVVWIIIAHKRMRTVTNYLIANLSIADIMVSTLNVIFNFIYMRSSHWPFGAVYCKISSFIGVLSVSASVLSLVCIAMDRYVAIIYPLKPRLGQTAIVCLIVLVWILSILFAMPMLVYSTTWSASYVNGDVRVICYQHWPDGPPAGITNEGYSVSRWDQAYCVILFLVNFLIPLAIMAFAYSEISKELWGSQHIGEWTQRQYDVIRSKRKIVKMLILIVVAFSVCWFPYQLYFVIVAFFPELSYEPYVQELFLALYWLAMSNSMYNPIIYCWMNQTFRQGFKRAFRWCPGIVYEPSEISARRQNITNQNGPQQFRCCHCPASQADPHHLRQGFRPEYRNGSSSFVVTAPFSSRVTVGKRTQQAHSVAEVTSGPSWRQWATNGRLQRGPHRNGGNNVEMVTFASS